MDVDGIDVQVIYPTRGISLSAAREVDLAVDIARAYNDWLAEFCSTNPERLKGVALVALQDVAAAVKEARRAVEELGFVGVMMPTNVLDQDIGLRQFWPFYEEVERLNVGLAFHGGIRASQRMTAASALHRRAHPGVPARLHGCPHGLHLQRRAGAVSEIAHRRAGSQLWVGPFPNGPDGRRVRSTRQERSASAQEKTERVSYQRAVLLRLRIGRNYFALRGRADRIGQAALLLRLSPLGHLLAALRSRRDETRRPDRLDKKRFLAENAQRFYGFKTSFMRVAA